MSEQKEVDFHSEFDLEDDGGDAVSWLVTGILVAESLVVARDEEKTGFCKANYEMMKAMVR